VSKQYFRKIVSTKKEAGPFMALPYIVRINLIYPS
jgi:hypothetical protein